MWYRGKSNEEKGEQNLTSPFVRPDRPGECETTDCCYLVVAASMHNEGPTATRRVTCNMCSVVRLGACATTVITSNMHSS